jgi:hypothetical protein
MGQELGKHSIDIPYIAGFFGSIYSDTPIDSEENQKLVLSLKEPIKT